MGEITREGQQAARENETEQAGLGLFAFEKLLRDAWFIVKLLNCFTGNDEVEFPQGKGPAQMGFGRAGPPADDALLPGLPNSLVLLCILPRLPWYVRPLLRATSMAWKDALDALSPHDSLLARSIYRQNASSEKNLVKVQHLKGREHVISMYDQGQERWRNLPTLPCASFPPLYIYAKFLGSRDLNNSIQMDYISGKIVAACVTEGFDVSVGHVWILDIEGGMWKWEKRPSIHTKNPRGLRVVSKVIEMEGRVFMHRHGMWDDIKPLVYDVARDEWIQLPDAVHDFPVRWRYVVSIAFKSNPDRKFVFALGIYGSRAITKFLEPKTLRWMDYF